MGCGGGGVGGRGEEGNGGVGDRWSRDGGTCNALSSGRDGGDNVLVGGGMGGINESTSSPIPMLGISVKVAPLALAAADGPIPPAPGVPPPSAGGTCNGSFSGSPKEGGLTWGVFNVSVSLCSKGLHILKYFSYTSLLIK